MTSKKLLEELIPEKLTEEHIKTLERVKTNPVKYQEICEETKEFIMSKDLLDRAFKNQKIDYNNLNEKDIKRIEYAVVLMKNYI